MLKLNQNWAYLRSSFLIMKMKIIKLESPDLLLQFSTFIRCNFFK